MLYVNLFADGDALLECDPQGDASVCVLLPQEHAEALAQLLISAEASAALARLFLAGLEAAQDTTHIHTINRLTGDSSLANARQGGVAVLGG